MDRLQALEVFVAIADAGSFAKAAERLRLSPPAVSRAMAGLEERLAVRLVNRTTRSLSLTAEGARFLARARSILSELEAAEADLAGRAQTPSGHLTVTASVTFGRYPLAPVVAPFLRAHPDVQLSVLLLDRVVNLVEEGIDIAIRIGELADSSFIARRIGAVQRVLVASPGYLAAHGTPKGIEDLADHQMIIFSGLQASRECRVFFQHVRQPGAAGGGAGEKNPARLEVSDAALALAAARADLGIVAAPCYMAGATVEAGDLVPVLRDHWPPIAPVHIVHPQARLVTPKVRAFVDFMARALPERMARLSGPLA